MGKIQKNILCAVIWQTEVVILQHEKAKGLLALSLSAAGAGKAKT